ncbi:hypothetical protein F4825DRAFT_439894 [Nemania diffusa]|nr:hypothetical protein F4825DRAFT_439894 [Nemania diffusa]
MLQFEWRDNSVANSSNALGRELRSGLGRHGRIRLFEAYVSYAHGDEKLEYIYGKRKLAHLFNLKNMWDLNNVFAYNNALPTHYPS